MELSFSLSKKNIVLIGATGVLGSVFAHGLARAGASLALLARQPAAVENLTKQIQAIGGTAVGSIADVCHESELRRAHDQFREHLGSIDIIINAAGGNQKGATIGPSESILDIQPQSIRSVIELNFMGSLLPIQVFGRDLVEKKAGAIINITSLAAIRPLTRVAGYSAAKAAVSNLTQWLAVELAQKYGEGIRVNAIAPGFFISEQNRHLLTNPDGSLTDRGKRVIEQTPFGRFGKPEELIGTLIWLCSDASKFVTGTVIPVDGGFNAFAGV